MLRPGGFAMTDRGLSACGFAPGDKVLEIGCGEGETLEHMEKVYGLDLTAVDIDLSMVSKAKERGLAAEIRYGDGGFLEGFLSNTFDGVVMECVLSLIHKPQEALHEVWCVLKHGGRLFLSDLYHRDPSARDMEALARRAAADAVRPHEYGDCESDEDVRMVDFFYDGRFYLDPLKRYMRSLGYRILLEEDRTKDLQEYAAEKAMDGEQLCGGFRRPGRTGYFLMAAEKE